MIRNNSNSVIFRNNLLLKKNHSNPHILKYFDELVYHGII
jgi:hypothetical protein